MNTDNVMDVTIMGREFRINCPEEEREELLLAATYLDEKMHKIKDEGKIIGSERIAIAAALSITHELLMLQTGNGFDIGELRRRIGLMHEKIDDVLIEQEKNTN